MTPELGVFLLLLALASTVYALMASLVGARKDNAALVASARNAVIVTWLALTAAILLLVSFLLSNHFNVAYVWQVTDRAMPAYLIVTALWGGQAGSLLFWSWLMSAFAAWVMLRSWRQERSLMPFVIAVLMGTLGFFIFLVTFWENPFASYWQMPTGEVSATLFAPSSFLGGITTGWTRLAEDAPGLLGVVLRGVVPLAAPPGSFAFIPFDGQGLNPLLHHPGMIVHPPMLYLGFVGFVVPYSFGIAALARGTPSDSWIHATRRWALVAWLFLGLGLLLGSWWAYDVLGWGGYWAWDPVENAALMPWLTGTAFLHSVRVQEKRGILRRWNIVLITLTYLQVVLGTFATRSGFVSSVHSFAQSAVGPLFFMFLGVWLIVSVWLLIKRWDDLAAVRSLESLFSRETFYLVNNLLFVSLSAGVGLGTYWPVFTELLSQASARIERSSLGPPYYVRTTGPLVLMLVLLMGIAPLIAWRRASLKRLGQALLWPVGLTILAIVTLVLFGVVDAAALTFFGVAILAGLVTLLEFHRGAMARVRSRRESYLVALWTLLKRNRRRYGGYLIHLGVVVATIGIVASWSFQTETQRAVSAGQTITLGSYVLEYETLERFVATDGRIVTRAHTIVYHNGHEVARLSPRIDHYPSGQPASIPGKYTTLTGDDFYVLLVTWEATSLSSATFKLYHNPLVNWLWAGGVIFILGTLVAAWPGYEATHYATSVATRRSVHRAAVG